MALTMRVMTPLTLNCLHELPSVSSSSATTEIGRRKAHSSTAAASSSSSVSMRCHRRVVCASTTPRPAAHGGSSGGVGRAGVRVLHSAAPSSGASAASAVAARFVAARAYDPKQSDYDPNTMSFGEKLIAAFRIFFPSLSKAREDTTARNDAKKRLRMILVADRCSMTPKTMSEMKQSIVTAISDYVEVDEVHDVDLNVTNDPDMGTIYSVSVPVKRVKPSVVGPDEWVETGESVELGDLGDMGVQEMVLEEDPYYGDGI